MIPSDENSNMPFLRTNKGLRIKTKDLKLTLVILKFVSCKMQITQTKKDSLIYPTAWGLNNSQIQTHIVKTWH